jgi:hypothetical protein
LREVISAQVKSTQFLFPEFTPHDEEHHLSRLFSISDEMLTSVRYEKMNAAELFLLACGLYAHDWGMAVGEEEIAYLRNGAKRELKKDTFTPLQDEAERLRSFAGRHGICLLNKIDDDPLRAYVRETHAWRSGVRVRTFFRAAGHFIPEALARVCQGHWLEFSELDDERRFSQRTSVLGYSVNLRAIALYVRLVDLFDIADDRTPYAVWRFVAPRNPRARMEWEKHRALSPVAGSNLIARECSKFSQIKFIVATITSSSENYFRTALMPFECAASWFSEAAIAVISALASMTQSFSKLSMVPTAMQ